MLLSTHNLALSSVADVRSGITDERNSDTGEYCYQLIQPTSLTTSGDLGGIITVRRKRELPSDDLVRTGDLLLRRLNTGTPFVIRSCPDNAVISTNLYRIRPNERVNVNYLAYLFDAGGLLGSIEHTIGSGTAIKSVSAKQLCDLPIPMIPLATQTQLGRYWMLSRVRASLMEQLEREYNLLVKIILPKVTL